MIQEEPCLVSNLHSLGLRGRIAGQKVEKRSWTTAQLQVKRSTCNLPGYWFVCTQLAIQRVVCGSERPWSPASLTNVIKGRHALTTLLHIISEFLTQTIWGREGQLGALWPTAWEAEVSLSNM